jgi:hypothetical protein
MKRILMVGVSLVLGMTLASEDRDWGFSKDTVYEWHPGGDSVYLVNTGSDTLKLDLVRAMDIGSSPWVETTISYRPFEGDPLLLQLFQQPDQYRIFLIPEGRNLLPSNESALFRNFALGAPPITSKGGRSLALTSDTITMGVRLIAQSGEEDTLIVVGLFSPGSSLISRPPLWRRESSKLLERDLRGRRIVPSGHFPVLER